MRYFLCLNRPLYTIYAPPRFASPRLGRLASADATTGATAAAAAPDYRRSSVVRCCCYCCYRCSRYRRRRTKSRRTPKSLQRCAESLQVTALTSLLGVEAGRRRAEQVKGITRRICIVLPWPVRSAFQRLFMNGRMQVVRPASVPTL